MPPSLGRGRVTPTIVVILCRLNSTFFSALRLKPDQAFGDDFEEESEPIGTCEALYDFEGTKPFSHIAKLASF